MHTELLVRLTRIVNQIASSAGLSEGLDHAIKALGLLLGADRAVVILSDGHSRIVSHEYLSKPSIPSILGMATAHSLHFEAIMASVTPVTMNMAQLAQLKSVELVQRGQVKSAIMIPLSFKGVPFAILAAMDCEEDRQWEPSEVALVHLVALVAAPILGCLRLTAAVQAAAESFNGQLKDAVGPSAIKSDGFLRGVQETTVSQYDERELAVSFPHLSKRERQILSRLEMTNREIGNALFTEESTIKWHVRNLLGKLGARSRQEAVAMLHKAVLPSVAAKLSLIALAYFPLGY